MTYLLVTALLISVIGNVLSLLYIQHIRQVNDDLQDTVNGLWMFGTQIGDDEE